ncbi:MAG TPA: hypothetical protein VGG79_25005 [Roseiarcus sp.]
MSASEEFTYNSFTRQKYITNFLSQEHILGTASLAQTLTALDDVVTLRNSDGYTASQNVELRDLEYYLRGYAGKMQLQTGTLDFSISTLYNIGGPGGLALYNAKKAYDESQGRQTSGPGEFPNSPPGGWAANLAGWNNGMENAPLGSVDLDNLSIPSLLVNGFATSLLASPNVGLFFLGGQSPGQLYSFDPTIGQSIAISTQGSAISSFEIGDDPDLADLILEISVGGKIYSYEAGTLFDFVDLLGSPIYSFVVSGFPSSLQGK